MGTVFDLGLMIVQAYQFFCRGSRLNFSLRTLFVERHRHVTQEPISVSTHYAQRSFRPTRNGNQPGQQANYMAVSSALPGRSPDVI